MLASDLVEGAGAYVAPEAEAQEVVRLMRYGDAVPVVDAGLAPIGIVTRNSLVQRGMATAAELPRPPAFLLRNRRPPPPRLHGLLAGDLMASPVISAPANAPVDEAGRVMEAHQINYLPLVREGRFIGLLRRADIERAKCGAAPPSHAEGPSAAKFRSLVIAHEQREDAERADIARKARELREAQVKELADRRLTEAQWRDMLSAAQRAAGAGLKEHLLMRFPSQLCRDGGRAINAPDSSWPQTLRGEAADVYLRWRRELEPAGFGLAAQIIDFPDGLPGDAALFLSWGG